MIQLQTPSEKLEIFSHSGLQTKQALASLCESSAQSELPMILNAGYQNFRSQFLASKDHWIQPFLGEDYSKLILFETETKFGRLAFDWIQFGYRKPTGLHLHSCYMIEELFEGTLQEDVYHPTDDQLYAFHSTRLRHSPEFRYHYDEDGAPHNVEALKPKTWGLCLHLGERGVQFIPPSKIKQAPYG